MRNNQPQKTIKSSSFQKPDDDRQNSLTTTSLLRLQDPEEKHTAGKETGTKKTEEKKAEDRLRQGEIENNETKKTEEASPPPPPEVQYTIGAALEDVDRFLTTLSSPRGSSGIEIPVFVQKFLNLVEELITKHESGELKDKWGQISEDDTFFLDSVQRISKLCKLISDSDFKSDHGLINSISATHQRAMSFLEDEFRILLEEFRSVVNLDQNGGGNQAAENQEHSTNHQTENSNPPEYSPEILSKLNKIAKEMITGGCESECCDIYITVRRNAFDETLNKLRFEKISMDEIQKMQWEALEREIPIWINVYKECSTTLFAAERKLAEEIFTNFPSISIGLFSNLTRGVLIRFFNFAEAVAMTKHSAERLFKFLDMYEALRENIPAIDTLFPKQLATDLRSEGGITLHRIKEAAVGHFCDLETSIQSDMEKREKSPPVPGGAVHPLTRYTMNYLKYACEFKGTIEQVFMEEQSDPQSSDLNSAESGNNKQAAVAATANSEEENESPFARQLAKVMDLLDTNLEAKSRQYRDVPLSCIFMMNNGRYILQKIKGSAEIYAAMGPNWYRKKSSELPNFHKSYTRETWSNLLGCLNHEGLTNHGKVMKPVVKERLKSFNQMFDEIHKTQSTWVVHDEQLQSELRVSIHAVLVPAYRSFLARFGQVLAPGRQTEKYVKFQLEDVENYIEELFDGNVSSKRRILNL